MAYTKIHPITKTLALAIDYITKDRPAAKDDILDALDYIVSDKTEDKTVYKTLTSTLGCSGGKAKELFSLVRKIHDGKHRSVQTKEGEEIVAWHCIQTFNEKIEIEKSNEIGMKLARECFGEHLCVVSTHNNTEHTHNHIIFNAWETVSGKKYHSCTASYRKIRSVSDRLCKEYNLHIMEETKDHKLIYWKDSNHITHSYEPTERKTKLRAGEYAKANDYRNTEAFSKKEAAEKKNRDIIKNDIDRIMPEVSDYNELLERLVFIGYKIRSKTKAGEWLKYIAFTPPGKQKGTRDYKLGDAYTREKLENKINALFQEKITSGQAVTIKLEEYNVGDFNLNRQLSIENRRKIKLKRKFYEELAGSQESDNLELFFLDDIESIDRRLDFVNQNQYDRSAIGASYKSKTQNYIEMINSDIRCINFIENRCTNTMKSLSDTVEGLLNQRASVYKQLNEVKNSLALFKETHNNPILLRYKARYTELLDKMALIDEQIKSYDEVIAVIEVTDNVNKRIYSIQIKNYYDMEERFRYNDNTFQNREEAFYFEK